MESNDSKEAAYRINVTVLGKSGSGKTATLIKLLTKRYIGEYSSATDRYQFLVCNDNKEYNVTIQDTNEEIAANLENVIKWSHIVVVMFSIIDRSSFNKAQVIVQNITERYLQENNKSDLSICLVANKTDLNRFRVIQNEEIILLTKEAPISYHETNAVGSYLMVENMFLQIIKNHLNDEDAVLEGQTQCISLRDKCPSPFTRIGMFNLSNRRLTTRALLNSGMSMTDLRDRRSSIENDQRSRNNETDTNLSSSKTSLNTIFNSSTKRIKTEGFKLFKRPK